MTKAKLLLKLAEVAGRGTAAARVHAADVTVHCQVIHSEVQARARIVGTRFNHPWRTMTEKSLSQGLKLEHGTKVRGIGILLQALLRLFKAACLANAT